MPQIVLENLTITFSDKPVLEEVNASIYQGDKIALIGRNGQGKSTLMKIIAGNITATNGEVKVKNGITISYLPQDVPIDSDETVFSIVALGLPNGDILNHYQRAISYNNLKDIEKYQRKIENLAIWDSLHNVNTIISKFGLEGSAILKSLSGGWRRRVLLAQALISDPDILMLDEPTNHMDIDAILNLEKMLINTPKTIVLISHDRSFVNNVVNKIFDLDRGKLRTFDCGYKNYLKRKEEILNAEELANIRFDKKLAEEEQWIRQGIKARRKRNEGRVRSLMNMRNEFNNRRKTQGNIKIHNLEQEEKFSKVVFEVKNISYQIGDKKLINDFSTLVLKGDKIGIIGGNGVGKSTLIRLLLGELKPDSGSIRSAKDLKIAYFSQIFQELDDKILVKDFIADGSDRIIINGKNKHVIGYLRQFLFTGKKALAPIKMLSGGEKNRLMLAKILSKPANILVLDEPTNDLDVETLELLEEMLAEYKGTLIVITHDREFLNNVVYTTIFMNNKDIIRYNGGYDDILLIDNHKENNEKAIADERKVNKNATKIKQKNLKRLMQKIEKQEQIINDLKLEASEKDFYTQDDYLLKLENISTLENKLSELYEEWEVLDGK